MPGNRHITHTLFLTISTDNLLLIKFSIPFEAFDSTPIVKTRSGPTLNTTKIQDNKLRLQSFNILFTFVPENSL